MPEKVILSHSLCKSANMNSILDSNNGRVQPALHSRISLIGICNLLLYSNADIAARHSIHNRSEAMACDRSGYDTRFLRSLARRIQYMDVET